MLALAGAAVLVAATAVPANAYSSSGGAYSCSAPRTVATYSSGGSTSGYIYHSQTKDGVVWGKSWQNAAPAYRVFSKGFASISAWYVSTDAIATNRGATCLT